MPQGCFTGQGGAGNPLDRFPASLPRASGLGTPTRNLPIPGTDVCSCHKSCAKRCAKSSATSCAASSARVVQLVPAGSPSDDTSTDGGSASILRQLSSDFHFPFIFITSLSFVDGVLLAKPLQMLQISALFFPELDYSSFALSAAVT